MTEIGIETGISNAAKDVPVRLHDGPQSGTREIRATRETLRPVIWMSVAQDAIHGTALSRLDLPTRTLLSALDHRIAAVAAAVAAPPSDEAEAVLQLEAALSTPTTETDTAILVIDQLQNDHIAHGAAHLHAGTEMHETTATSTGGTAMTADFFQESTTLT